MFSDPTTSLIVIIVIAVGLTMGAYQLLINKHYWGPKGRPKKQDPKDDKE